VNSKVFCCEDREGQEQQPRLWSAKQRQTEFNLLKEECQEKFAEYLTQNRTSQEGWLAPAVAWIR
jgi:hypothetical protein